MKTKILIALFLCFATTGFCQTKLFTKAGKISFYSKSTMENIEAVNNKAVSVWDVTSGAMEFSVLMKGFEFEKALMQEHFNENYVESDKYPKALFKGTVENSSAITITKDGTYTAKVNGSLTLHGVTKPISTTATIVVKGGVVSSTANFNVLVKDYNISIPALVADNISKTISITVSVPAYSVLGGK